VDVLTRFRKRFIAGMTILALIAIPAFVTSASAGDCHSANGHCYAGQSGTTAVKGIDGYIRGSGTVMADPQAHFNAHFVNLCPTTSCTSWVQLGPYQGTINVISSPNVMHMYIENQNACVGYGIGDHGAPPTPNYPYYVYYSGVTQTVGGCTGQRLYYYKVGSVTNPPISDGWLTTTTGIPVAETEIFGGEDVGLDWFGCDNSGNASSSFGVHLLNASSQWVTWTAANEPGSQPIANAPNVFQQLQAWYSFKTHD
jgi:hypothetical protein